MIVAVRPPQRMLSEVLPARGSEPTHLLAAPPLPPTQLAPSPRPPPSLLERALGLAGAGRSTVACLMGAVMGTQALFTPVAVARPRETKPPAPIECTERDPGNRLSDAGRHPYGSAARTLAQEALHIRQHPRVNHPYLRLKRELVDHLGRLGLLRPSPDHLHISDVDTEHGPAVLRSALGLLPLVKGGTATLSIANPPLSFIRTVLRPGQLARFERDLSDPFEENQPEPPTTVKGAIDLSLDALELSVLQKTFRIAKLRQERGQVPASARIFVNMSFGQSPDRIAGELALMALTAPQGSQLYRTAARILHAKPVQLPEEIDPEELLNPGGPCGVAPEDQRRSKALQQGDAADFARFERQHARLKRAFAYPKLKAAMATPEFQRRLQEARADLEAQLLAGRREGIMVFEAAGNEHSDAARTGDPQMSDTTSSGLRGLIRVGAIDLGKVSTHADDRVADFSGAGRVTVSTPGVHIPVWLEDGRITDSEGTSFASPIAVELAVAAAAVAPQLSVDQLEALLQDPRVVRNIRGTSRDGAGALDPFALVLVAANPQLTRAQIDQAWEKLRDRNADLVALKRSLGLGSPAE